MTIMVLVIASVAFVTVVWSTIVHFLSERRVHRRIGNLIDRTMNSVEHSEAHIARMLEAETGAVPEYEGPQGSQSGELSVIIARLEQESQALAKILKEMPPKNNSGITSASPANTPSSYASPEPRRSLASQEYPDLGLVAFRESGFTYGGRIRANVGPSGIGFRRLQRSPVLTVTIQYEDLALRPEFRLIRTHTPERDYTPMEKLRLVLFAPTAMVGVSEVLEETRSSFYESRFHLERLLHEPSQPFSAKLIQIP